MKLRTPSLLRGFTLMELLIVIGLIAVLVVGFSAALTGGAKSVALESAHAQLANVATSVRARALSGGRPVRVLVSNQPSRSDYRRLLVILQLNAPGLSTAVASNWSPIETALLPDGIYLLPNTNQISAGLLAEPERWVKPDGASLRSSLFATATFAFNFDGNTENWEYFGFTENGANATNQGSLILTTGRTKAPVSSMGSPSIELTNPDSIRGLMFSNYGVARLIHDRHGF